MEPLSLEWSDSLPDSLPAYFIEGPVPRIVINLARWHEMTPAERRVLLAHEYAHHRLGTTYTLHAVLRCPDFVQWLELQTDKDSIRDLIPDHDIVVAIADGCQTLYEFAEAWGVDEDTAEARLRLWRKGA